jgi:hypothetical protein
MDPTPASIAELAVESRIILKSKSTSGSSAAAVENHPAHIVPMRTTAQRVPNLDISPLRNEATGIFALGL